MTSMFFNSTPYQSTPDMTIHWCEWPETTASVSSSTTTTSTTSSATTAFVRMLPTERRIQSSYPHGSENQAEQTRTSGAELVDTRKNQGLTPDNDIRIRKQGSTTGGSGAYVSSITIPTHTWTPALSAWILPSRKRANHRQASFIWNFKWNSPRR